LLFGKHDIVVLWYIGVGLPKSVRKASYRTGPDTNLDNYVPVPFSTTRSSLEHGDLYAWVHTCMLKQTNI
jgi:hypothetical protein